MFIKFRNVSCSLESAKCGLLQEARKVFTMLLIRDVVSWNSLIAGYVEYGPFSDIFKCIQQMNLEETVPKDATYL